MTKNKLLKTLLPLLVGLAAAVITFWVLLFLIYPANQINLVTLGLREPTITPTQQTSTPTLTSTPRPSATSTITSTPEPTGTPFPSSAFLVADSSSIHPALSVNGESIIILDEQNAEVSPSLDHFQWISSDQISQDIGKEMPEPYYATFGAGSIKWKTDTILKPALYEIFVLDTTFSSGGSLDFTVRVNDQIIEPFIGQSYVQYRSSQGEPPQYTDVWQSIGIYNIDQIAELSISTEWGLRNELSIVAVDRVLILEHSEITRTILEQLPFGQQTYIVDDNDASVEPAQYWKYWEDLQVWGNQYQVITDPPLDSYATWTVSQTVPHGEYEVLVYIPKINGSAEVTYKFFAGGLQLQQEDGSLEIILPDGQGRNKDPQWISLGTWTISEHFGNSVRIALSLSASAEARGDIAIDAVAFIKK
ncbi:MAG: hypothetical protein K8R40_11795 [Anaerolineaceae bacterium]|nr:hypothetical protein [Anaerolineaceae bacterium]